MVLHSFQGALVPAAAEFRAALLASLGQTPKPWRLCFTLPPQPPPALAAATLGENHGATRVTTAPAAHGRRRRMAGRQRALRQVEKSLDRTAQVASAAAMPPDTVRARARHQYLPGDIEGRVPQLSFEAGQIIVVLPGGSLGGGGTLDLAADTWVGCLEQDGAWDCQDVPS